MAEQSWDSEKYPINSRGNYPKPVDHSDGKYLKSLYNVGPEKPIGSLPVETITDLCRARVNDVKRYLKSRGLKVLHYEDVRRIFRNSSERVYAFDEEALQTLVDNHSDLLEPIKWPLKAKQFVEKIDRCSVPHRTPLFNLIADAFADYENPYRMK